MLDFDTKNDWFLAGIKNYLYYKERISLKFAKTSPKKTLPSFPAKSWEVLEDINEFMNKNFIYTSDPLWGTFDYYTHPETVMAEIIQLPKNKEYGLDCDDFAHFAYSTAIWNGYPEKDITMVTIIPDLIKYPWELPYAHVITVFSYQGSVDSWKGVIDTNTSAKNQIYWFKQTNKSEERMEQVILNHFSKVYTENGVPKYFLILSLQDCVKKQHLFQLD